MEIETNVETSICQTNGLVRMKFEYQTSTANIVTMCTAFYRTRMFEYMTVTVYLLR